MQAYDYKREVRFINEGTRWSWIGDGQGLLEEEYLKQLGKAGWELVSVVPTTDQRNAGRTEFLTFYFKKPR